LDEFGEDLDWNGAIDVDDLGVAMVRKGLGLD
jgi:hypothetical protein